LERQADGQPDRQILTPVLVSSRTATCTARSRASSGNLCIQLCHWPRNCTNNGAALAAQRFKNYVHPHLRTNRKIIGAAVSGPLSRCTAYRSAADSGALCALRRAKPSQRHSFITIERGYSKVELSGLHPNNAWVLCSHLWNSCSASRAGQLCARDSSRSCTLN